MPRIHPTSIIGSRVEMADDVEVGPNCVLDGQIHIGPGTRLIGNVYLKGPLRIGAGNMIYPFCCLGFEPQDRKFPVEREGAGLIIGDGNILREGVTIHRATGETPTTVGNHNYLMGNTHLGHDVTIGDHCMLANGALLGGHAVLGDNVIIGGNGGAHQFCRVGRLAMISGTTAVVKDVPPFCTSYDMRSVGSLNIVGLRRAGYRDNMAAVKRAFEILYLEQHTNAVAVEIIEQELAHDPLAMEMADFVRCSKRGISRYKSHRGD